MRYHVIFSVKGHIERLGKLAPFANSSATSFIQYYDSNDSKYIDFATLDIKIGDEIYFAKKEKNKFGRFSNKITNTKIGLVSSVATERVISNTAIGEDLFEQNKLASAEVFVTRNLNKTYEMYSYPVDCYIGAANYSDSILSLFFKRNNDLIDEVRINTPKDRTVEVLNLILAQFSNPNKRHYTEIGNTLLGKRSSIFVSVNKVITSIAKNIN
tara:strand:- start:2170 stop:2808 length:639 start_codon:yes stop_codon:yes gene_type:complete